MTKLVVAKLRQNWSEGQLKSSLKSPNFSYNPLNTLNKRNISTGRPLDFKLLQLEEELKDFSGRKQRSVSPASMYLSNNEKGKNTRSLYNGNNF